MTHSSFRVVTAPTVEPLSVTEVKDFLRIDSGDYSDATTVVQSIKPGLQSIAANYTLVGTGVEVLNYSALVILDSGTNGNTGTVDVKVQESDDNITYIDVSGGSFTQITITNDESVYEYQYIGSKRYIRAVATVANAACSFGVSIIKGASTSAEDTLLSTLIITARKYCEDYLNKAFITQTLEYILQDFPDWSNYITLPYSPVQSITSIKYYGTDETEYTMSTSDYGVDTYSIPGRASLKYSKLWPTQTLRPYNGVIIRYVAGYGNTSASIPENIKQAMLMLIGTWYENREDSQYKKLDSIPFGTKQLLNMERVVSL